MISIPRPSMAMHSHDVPGFKYRLENNFYPPDGDPVDHMLGWASTYATSRGGLVALVINCHGYYSASGCGGTSTGGYGLKIGAGLYRWNTGKFSMLSGLVTNIIITACGTARISPVDSAGDGDGNLFCSEIARASGAYVIAGTTHQVGALWLPDDNIDDYEGLTLRYSPAGAVDWSHDYGRGLIDGLINGWD